ncbi:SusC/RagA family TonB-linked outer membrane protein [Mucilaginibacter polytrichastri]|uniref:SusC/RagA family TonB-linked outer membrane protein n=1 Tax=Mucilaginibacter polytrichastri TaxID=1302689 RepID=UPI0008E34715|nr:SusC/RagA family TonB-linked outer membrane protein [Mucilaginibacter polytrichastri]SFT20866.1 TonB-linked outer membrane protein, SusC/RagA family [Mucilaginibacter polytrichastri]
MEKKSLPLFMCTVLTVTMLLQSAGIAMAGGRTVLKIIYNTNTPNETSRASAESEIVSIAITGKVMDEKGMTLPGVTVTEKGTKNATITTSSGTYKLNVAGKSAVLVFTFVGYKPIEIPVNNETIVNASMAPAVSALNEVIVTALGIRREAKSLGYSAQKADVQALQTNRTTNLANALEGQVAGLDVSPPAAGPGGSTKIRLRGQSSFTADNSPLIVINGLPMSQGASSTNGYTQNTDQGDNLQGINQDDIESMTILKGSTAAALYGSRAVNGAIIITTKSGAKNTGIGVEFNSNFTLSKALDFTDFQYEYGQGENNKRPLTQGDAQSSGAWSFGVPFDNALTYQFDGVQRPYAPVKKRINTFFRNAPSFSNTLAISGGNDKGSFRVSFANQDAKGIVPNNDYHKKIFNIGINYKLTEKLTAQFNVNYDHEFNNNPPVIGVQGLSIPTSIYRLANSIDFDVLKAGAIDANGNEAPTSRFSTVTNPYWIMAKQFQKQTKDHLLGTAVLRYQFFDWLYLQGRASTDLLQTTFESNTPTGTLSVGAAPTGLFNGGYAINTSNLRQNNFDFLLGGGRKFRNFGFNATVGGNNYPLVNSTFNESVTNFYIRDLYTIGNGVTATSSYNLSKQTVNSLYGTAEFSYKSLFYLNVTGRTDWYSVLARDIDHYFYPSVSGSFVFSELLPNAKWLNFGKLRVAVSETGSAQGIGAYNTLTFALAQNPFNGSPLGSINNTSSPNPRIKPFGVKEKEIGLEMHMFNNRINLDIAAYDKKTTNQAVPISLSTATGYSSTLVNLGGLDNKGLELFLELVPVQNSKISWRTSFNTAFNSSKVLSLANNQKQLVVGSPEFFGTIADVVGLPLNQIQGATYKRNAAGQILLTGGKPIASALPVNFGSGLPKATGGWTNTVNYKGFTFVAHFDYKAGGKVLSSTNLNLLREGLSKESLPGRVGGVLFQGVNSTDGLPNTTAVNAEDFYANYRSTNILDPFIYSSSFIKLRNLSLGYDLSRFIDKKYIKSLVLSAVCHNVWVIKKYTPNIDPEAISSSGDNLTGYEQASLPTVRTYGFNLNLKF